MNGASSVGFGSSLLDSPTFLASIAGFGVLALVCAAAAYYLAARMLRRTKARGLHQNQSGSAVAVDFVLVLPLFLILISMLLQLAMLMNGSMIVHYAAYSAARSARVFAFEEADMDLKVWTSKPLLDQGGVREKAERAARFALMAASPSNSSISGLDQSSWIGTLTDNSELANLGTKADAMRAKAAYAFDPANSKVELEVKSEEFAGVALAAHYIEATVDFEFYLPLFPAMVFQPVTERQGRYFRTIHATMRVF